MKTVIVYASVHHGNTKKIVDVIAETLSADVYRVEDVSTVNFDEYDVIGLASGIYYHTMHQAILKTIHENVQKTHHVFIAVTCGARYRDHTKKLRKSLTQRGINVLGYFQCRGYDTYGLLKLIGGISKKHPNARDLLQAKAFAETVKTKLTAHKNKVSIGPKKREVS